MERFSPQGWGQHLSVCTFEINTPHPPPHPLPSPRVFLSYFYQSVISLFKNILHSINSFSDGHSKFFITWQTKKLKFLLNNKVKHPTPLPSCVQRHVRLHLGMNGRNLPPALAAVDKTRLAMKLASLFVIYLCSLFCLLVGVHRAQNTRNTEMQQLMNN